MNEDRREILKSLYAAVDNWKGHEEARTLALSKRPGNEFLIESVRYATEMVEKIGRRIKEIEGV